MLSLGYFIIDIRKKMIVGKIVIQTLSNFINRFWKRRKKMTRIKEIPPKTRERLLDSNIPRVAYMAQKLFRHWEERGRVKHFLFGIGTDYKKLKYPMIW